MIKAVKDENNLFVSQSMKTTKTGLDFATEYHLGGTDALIISNLPPGNIRQCKTLEGKLLEIGKIKHGRKKYCV